MLSKIKTQTILAISCILSTSIALFIGRFHTILNNPFFTGDSGFRLNNADKIVVLFENRFWLPFLQLHINLFYHLNLPPWTFKLIPVFYFLIALICLGLLINKILNNSYQGILLSIFILCCFAQQRGIIYLNVNLYQEMIEIALFYLLLCLGMLDLRKSWILLIIASISLITRESNWVYLLVLSVLNWKKIIADRKYILSFAWLWAIPIIWFVLFPLQYALKTPHILQSIIMLNTNQHHLHGHFSSLLSLLYSIKNNKITLLIISLFIIYTLLFLYSKFTKEKIVHSNNFDTRFKSFSLCSIAIIYSIILLVDSYQITYGNLRQVVPLVPHLFLWCVLFYKESFKCSLPFRLFLQIILLLGLLSAFSQEKLFPFEEYTSADIRRNHQLESFSQNHYHQIKPTACIVGGNFHENLKLFTAPTLYMNRYFIQTPDANAYQNCDLAIIHKSIAFDNLEFKSLVQGINDDKSYSIYYR